MRILIRGAGDLATGIAYRLYKCGFEIIMTETKVPLTVRRTIAFSRAVYEGNAEVEHVTAKLTDGPEQIDDRIEERLAALKEEGKKAFITYTTAGLPDYDTTKNIMFAQEKAGIDIMEIGVPFSDPIHYLLVSSPLRYF